MFAWRDLHLLGGFVAAHPEMGADPGGTSPERHKVFIGTVFGAVESVSELDPRRRWSEWRCGSTEEHDGLGSRYTIVG